MVKITTKIKNGKRSASKREKRRLLKKHKEDPAKIAETAHNNLMAEVVPKWHELIQKEEEYVATLSKRERRFRAVQKVLGIVQDVTKVVPIPALVESDHATRHIIQEQKKYESAREKTVVKAAKQKIDQMNDIEDAVEEVQPASLYDLWADTRPSKKNSKPVVASAKRLLTTILPDPGQSYNPDVKEYQSVLERAGRVEAKKVLKSQRIEKRLNAASNDPNVISGGHDAMDGLNIQKRALEEEANLSEEVLNEKLLLVEELKLMREKASKPKPALPKSQLKGRKIHKIQLAKKQRKVREKFHKVQTLEAQREEAELLQKLEDVREEVRKEAKRQLRAKNSAFAYRSVTDATDILLPEEMPTRMSNMGQNLPSFFGSQARMLKGTHSKLF